MADIEAFEGLNEDRKFMHSKLQEAMEQRQKFIDEKLIKRFKELNIDYKAEILKEPKRIFKKFMVIYNKEDNTIQYRINDGTDEGILLIEFKDISFDSLLNYH